MFKQHSKTKTCAHCSEPRKKGSGYCKYHHSVWQKEYRARVRNEVESLKEEIALLEMGKPKSEFHRENGRFHSPDNDTPAAKIYHENGALAFEIWYKQGKMHRLGKPAWISYDTEGKVLLSKFYTEGVEKNG